MITLLTGILIVGCSAMKDLDKKEPTKEEKINEVFAATMKQDISSIDGLIEKNADFNVYDREGYTPLMRSIKFRNSNLAEKLIKGGAKIYQPHKENEDLTASLMVNNNDLEMKRIFKEEIKRYGKTIEAFILKGKYAKALEYSQKNYLPIDLNMPTRNKTSLGLVAELYQTKIQEESPIHYVGHIINQIDPQSNYFLDHDMSFKILIKIIKEDSQLLESLQALYTAYNKYFGSTKISDEQYTDITFMNLKLRALNDSGQAIPLNKFHIEVYKEIIRLEEVPNSTDWITLVKEVLRSKNEYQKKNEFLKESLFVLLSIAKSDTRYLRSSLELLNIWNSYGLPKAEYLFDDILLMILKAINLENYDINLFSSLTDGILAFSSNNQNRSQESIKFILKGDFKLSKKKELLKFIYQKTKKPLPKEIIAYAIEVGGIDSVHILLESVEFDPKEQETGVFVALFHARSAESAYSVLSLLKKNGVSLFTDNGAKALNVAFERFWKGDEAYKKSIDLLMSNIQSPINLMDNEDIFNILLSHLDFLKVEKKDWSLMTQFLKKLEKPLPKNNYITRINDFPVLGLPEIKVSLVWDYILTMYGIYKVSPKELDSMLVLLSEVTSTFPDENISMTFSGQKANLNPNRFLFQNMIPLSLILSVDEKSITKALSVDRVKEYKISLETSPPQLSWGTFIKGSVYNYYSSNPEFWKAVSKVLLNTNRNLKLPDGRSTIDFMKIMSYSGQFQKYQDLYQVLGSQQINLLGEDRRCLLNKGPVDAANLPDIKHAYEFLDPRSTDELPELLVGYSPVWANIGVFEALRPLKEKSCNSKAISVKEISFISQLIDTNLKPPFERRARISHTRRATTGSGYWSRQEIDCGKLSSVESKSSLNYSQLGIPLEKDEPYHEDFPKFVPPAGRCYTYKTASWAENSAKRSFFSSWHKCAVKNNDRKLLKSFKPLEKNGFISKEIPSYEKVYTCRWESL